MPEIGAGGSWADVSEYFLTLASLPSGWAVVVRPVMRIFFANEIMAVIERFLATQIVSKSHL